MYKLGWFSTGRGPGSLGLLKTMMEHIQSGDIDARIDFVFCSRERGETDATDTFLATVEGYGLPLVTFSYRKFRAGRQTMDEQGNLAPWRLDYDREVMNRLGGFSPDLSILAGYMLITGAEMCRRYDMINLHPAAPWGPAGTWQQVIWQLIGNKSEETGVMMHLATPELDEGPAVTYCTFPIQGGPFDVLWQEVEGLSLEEIKQGHGEDNALFQEIRRHGYVREAPLILATVRAFSQGKLKITADKQVVDTEGRPISGYNLTGEINEIIKAKPAE